MPSYETFCVLHPELPEVRVKELAAWMQKIVEDGKGTVSQVEEWGMRELAYRVKKQTRGHYIRLEYDTLAPVLKELERNLRLNENVLRFFSVVRTAPVVPSSQTTQTPTAAPPAAAEAGVVEEQ